MLYRKFRDLNSFQSSINLAYDHHDFKKVVSFIPTASAVEVIEDVFLSTASASSGRAKFLVGAYGRGKSHMLLVLLSLLRNKDLLHFAPLIQRIKSINPKLSSFVTEYIKSDKKLLPVIIQGSGTSLYQSFLSALHKTLQEEELADIAPETHFQSAISAIKLWEKDFPDTYDNFLTYLDEPFEEFILALKEYDVDALKRFASLYPRLTSGSSFNPLIGFDIVELYEQISIKLQPYGYDGIFVVYDEFSKYLESNISQVSYDDIKLLQDFAEKCNRSGENQLHLMLISHKDFDNYIDSNLAKHKIDGWRGVAGRFQYYYLHDNYSQIYSLMAVALEKDPAYWNQFSVKYESQLNELTTRAINSGIFGSMSNQDIIDTTLGCYPLHPATMFLLPRVSEQIAQNERTLFTFLSASGKYSLEEFLLHNQHAFSLVTPDYIFDYFEPLLKGLPYTSDVHRLYSLSLIALDKNKDNLLASKIIKCIALIYIVDQFDFMPPTYDTLVDIFYGNADNISQFDDTLSDLINNDCLIYLKRSNNHLKLKQSSGVNIPDKISQYIERHMPILDTITILNDSNFNRFLYPNRYNDTYEMTRYFSIEFIHSKTYWSIDDWDELTESYGADGVLYAIVPANSEDRAKIKYNLQYSGTDCSRAVFILPREYTNIDPILFEYEAVNKLQASVIDDSLLYEEYEIFREDLEELVHEFIQTYTHPESKRSLYYHKGKVVRINRKAKLSALLSDICDDIYYLTPVINNESINKNYLSTVAHNSRTRLLAGLLDDNLRPNLGLVGSGQDVSIMRSVLVQTGILKNFDSSPSIDFEPEDDRMLNVLRIIQSFFESTKSKGEQSFKALYDQLILSTYHIGLRTGVIPILIAVALHPEINFTTIRTNGHEVRVSANLLNDINNDPRLYTIILEDHNPVIETYLNQLELIFNNHLSEHDRVFGSYVMIANGMHRWFLALPKYSKDLASNFHGSSFNESTRLSKADLKLANSLRQSNDNPRKYILEDLFSIYDVDAPSLDIINRIKNAKALFDNAYENLIHVLKSEIIGLFGTSEDQVTVNEALHSWYISLKKRTKEHLFDNDENKILELMTLTCENDYSLITLLVHQVTGLRAEDVNSEVVKSFLEALRTFKSRVENFDKETIISHSFSSQYKLIMTDSQGTEIIRTFNKIEYSMRAELLLNDIRSSLEDMGQSITNQEKRQVLMDILEELT